MALKCVGVIIIQTKLNTSYCSLALQCEVQLVLVFSVSGQLFHLSSLRWEWGSQEVPDSLLENVRFCYKTFGIYQVCLSKFLGRKLFSLGSLKMLRQSGFLYNSFKLSPSAQSFCMQFILESSDRDSLLDSGYLNELRYIQQPLEIYRKNSNFFLQLWFRIDEVIYWERAKEEQASSEDRRVEGTLIWMVSCNGTLPNGKK